MAQFKVAGGVGKTSKLTPKGKFFDYTLLIIIMFLIAFGLVMVYSTSSYSATQQHGDAAFYLKKQMGATLLGLVVLAAVTFIPYKYWFKLRKAAYIIPLFTVLLIIPFGVSINNAKRWIIIAGVSFQPAEFVKLGIIISLSAFIYTSGKKMKRALNNFVYIVLAGIASVMILAITNNMSSAFIILAIAYIMLMVANDKPKWLIFLTVAVAIVVALYLAYFFNNPDKFDHFRYDRLKAWRNPEAYSSGTGYQTVQSLYAIGSGGFFGKGLGRSIQKLGFIPEAQNDMVFSVICEELGLFGGICVILLFVLMIWRFMVIANNAPDLFGSMLVVGVMAHISIQVMFNIAVVTNFFPNTGITLPFISYGGTSIVFLLIEMGIVLNVSKNIQVPVSIKSR